MTERRDSLTCRVMAPSRDAEFAADVTGLDQFRISLRMRDEGSPPEWLTFGRNVRIALIEGDKERVEVAASVVRIDPLGRTGVFVVQLRHLNSGDVAALTDMLGIMPPAPVPTLSSKGPRRRRPPAPPRPLPPHERRAHQRFAVSMDLWVSHGDTTYIMRVRDISQGGMLCEVPLNDEPHWIAEGAKLRMELFPEDGGDSIIFRGRIVRVLARTSKRPMAFGVCFETVAAQVLMHRLLRKLGAKAA